MQQEVWLRLGLKVDALYLMSYIILPHLSSTSSLLHGSHQHSRDCENVSRFRDLVLPRTDLAALCKVHHRCETCRVSLEESGLNLLNIMMQSVSGIVRPDILQTGVSDTKLTCMVESGRCQEHLSCSFLSAGYA